MKQPKARIGSVLHFYVPVEDGVLLNEFADKIKQTPLELAAMIIHNWCNTQRRKAIEDPSVVCWCGYESRKEHAAKQASQGDQ